MGRIKTTQVVQLSIFDLKRNGRLKRDSVMESRWLEYDEEDRLIVETYVHRNDPHIIVSEDHSGGFRVIQKIPLCTTPCFFGGWRYWFECSCRRRVGILYLLNRRFYCRACGNLAYPLQQANHMGRWKMFYKALQSLNWMQKIEHTRTKFWKGALTKRQLKRVKKLKDLSGQIE